MAGPTQPRVVFAAALLIAVGCLSGVAHAQTVLSRIEVTATPSGPGGALAGLIESFMNLLPSFDPNQSVPERYRRCQQAQQEFAQYCPPEVTAFNFDRLVEDRMDGTMVRSVSGFGDRLASYRNCITAFDGGLWVNSRETCANQFVGELGPLCGLTTSNGACSVELLQRLQTPWDGGGGIKDMPVGVRTAALAVEVCRTLQERVAERCEG